MKKLVVVLVLLFTFLGVIILALRWFERDFMCENLHDIVTDKRLLLDETIKNVVSSIQNPRALESSLSGEGLIYLDDGADIFEINWGELVIPERHATVGIFGDGITYENINIKNVDSIRVGYGYRKHIKVEFMRPLGKENGEFVEVQYKLHVECE